MAQESSFNLDRTSHKNSKKTCFRVESQPSVSVRRFRAALLGRRRRRLCCRIYIISVFLLLKQRLKVFRFENAQSRERERETTVFCGLTFEVCRATSLTRISAKLASSGPGIYPVSGTRRAVCGASRGEVALQRFAAGGDYVVGMTLAPRRVSRLARAPT